MAHWLTPERLSVYPRLVLAAVVCLSLGLTVTSEGGLDALGRPVGAYFSPFWAGAQLGRAGEAGAVYAADRLLEAQQAVAPGTTRVYLWPLPPPFLLLVLPFGRLPYLPGLLAWLGLGFGSYALVLLRKLGGRTGAWAVLAFPGALVCALNSQTGLLAAAVLAGAVGLLERRPLLAGGLLGAAAIRPELALVTGVALAAGRHLRAFGAALGTLAGTSLLSVALFGTQTWRAWGESLPWLGEVLARGDLPFFKLVSVYGASRLLGLGLELAAALQVATALAVLVALARAWRSEASVALKGSVLACAALLISPLTLHYDLVLLAPPLLWLAQDGCRRGWRPWEREVLAAAWILPLVAMPLAQVIRLQLAPLVVAAVLGLALQRIRRPA